MDFSYCILSLSMTVKMYIFTLKEALRGFSLVCPSHHRHSCALGPLLSELSVPEHTHCDTVVGDLIAKKDCSVTAVGEAVHSADSLDKGTIHVLDGVEPYDVKSHHTTQNGVQFKIYELFLS